MWYVPSLLDKPVRRVFLWNIVMYSKKESVQLHREGKWPDILEGTNEKTFMIQFLVNAYALTVLAHILIV